MGMHTGCLFGRVFYLWLAVGFILDLPHCVAVRYFRPGRRTELAAGALAEPVDRFPRRNSIAYYTCIYYVYTFFGVDIRGFYS